MNLFSDPELTARYEGWYSGVGRRADILEKSLLEKLLRDFSQVRSVLEIGCGTGHFSRWLAAKNLKVTGLDISAPMLAEARKLNCLCYQEGDALDLPFDDRSYDLAVLITTLEFVTDPLRALVEATRIARHGLILGVLNRWSLLTVNYRRSGKPLWSSASFFGPWELKRLVRDAAGQRFLGASWRTTIWPIPWVTDLPLPFGGFIGMAARLMPDD
ncbi:MAG: class I SAM-dependent methyltransferase [Candidatus Paceibacterota bacterium]